MTPRELILKTANMFKEAGVPDPENDAALLLSHLTGRPPLLLRLDIETNVPPETAGAFYVLAAQRAKRIPLQYILGSQTFYGRLFLTDERVLIPRPETAELCDLAIRTINGYYQAEGDNCFDRVSDRVPDRVSDRVPDRVSDRASNRASLKKHGIVSVLDLCCGSGCIGLTIALELPYTRVTLADISSDALKTARENAEKLGAGAVFALGDLFEPLGQERFDVIISNPPYIKAADFPSLQTEVLAEPHIALYGGEDGLDFYRRIISEAPDHLKPGGHIFLETGDGEAGNVRELLDRNSFTDIRIHKDMAGTERIATAVFPGTEDV